MMPKTDAPTGAAVDKIPPGQFLQTVRRIIIHALMKPQLPLGMFEPQEVVVIVRGENASWSLRAEAGAPQKWQKEKARPPRLQNRGRTT